MTQSRKLPAWITNRAEKRPYLHRLNIILRAAYTDLRPLKNGDWQRLLDELYFSIYNRKPEGEHAKDFAKIVADKIAVWEALETLKKQIEEGEPEDAAHERPILRLKLKDATLVSEYYDDDQGGIFGYRIESKDFATLLFYEFVNMLNLSGVVRVDFSQCSNQTCNTPFFPLRKPRPNTPGYCSNRCARLVAARNYRKKKTAGKKKKVSRKKKQKK